MMNFDIAEIIRQKQQKQPKSIIIGNGKRVILPGNPEEEIEPEEIVPLDD
jgi:hypothetical protein